MDRARVHIEIQEQLEGLSYALFCGWESAVLTHERRAYWETQDQVKQVQKAFVRQQDIAVVSSFVEEQLEKFAWASEAGKEGIGVWEMLKELERWVRCWPPK